MYIISNGHIGFRIMRLFLFVQRKSNSGTKSLDFKMNTKHGKNIKRGFISETLVVTKRNFDSIFK